MKMDVLEIKNKKYIVIAMISFFAVACMFVLTRSLEYKLLIFSLLSLSAVLSGFAQKEADTNPKLLSLLIISLCQLLILIFEMYYFESKGIYATVSMILEFTLYCTVMLVYYGSLIQNWQPEKLFLIIILPYGLFMTLCLPVKTAPDERTHIYTSYRISNVLLKNETVATNGDFSIREKDQEYLYLPIEFENSIDLMNSIYSSSLFVDNEETVLLENSECLNGNEVAYILSAVGISIGRILGLNAFWALTLGRLFNLLQYTACIYFAIKVMPYSKYVPLSVALLPIAIQQGMSYSYDSLVIALSIFVICGSLGYKYNSRVEYKKNKLLGVIVGGASVVLFFLKKHSYMFIALSSIVVLLSDNVYFEKFSKLAVKTMLVGICLFMGYTIINTVFHLGPYFKEPINPISWQNGVQGYTIQYFLNEPLDLIIVYIRTMVRFLPFYICSATSYDLGWLNIQIAPVFILVFIVLCLLSTQYESLVKINKLEKQYYILSSVFTVIAIVMALLISWTPKGVGVSLGVQGRYFIPLLVPVLLLLPNGEKIFQKSQNYFPVMYSLAIMVFSVFLITRF